MLSTSGQHLRQHFVAYLALFVALGGLLFAAANALVPHNSVGTAQVINGSLLRKDFKAGQLPRGSEVAGAAGLAGPAGPAGPAGTGGGLGDRAGPAGPRRAQLAMKEFKARPDRSVVAVDHRHGPGAGRSRRHPYGRRQVCPSGQLIVGGGASTTSTDPAVNITNSDFEHPAPGQPPDTWFATVVNGSASALT